MLEGLQARQVDNTNRLTPHPGRGKGIGQAHQGESRFLPKFIGENLINVFKDPISPTPLNSYRVRDRNSERGIENLAGHPFECLTLAAFS